MSVSGRLGHGLSAAALALAVVAPAAATTLRRASLEELVKNNAQIVIGEVVDARSYWNAEKSFIFTDVRIAPSRVLKGAPESRELTVTLMGGTVEDRTALIVGGAELALGQSYVLFVNEEDLPGLPGVPTVRDHCQGAFGVVKDKDGSQRAVSQAQGHPLVPDRAGLVEAPGGAEGLPLPAMIRSIEDAIAREAGAPGRTR
jgi:hypothetical protein